MYQLPVEKLEKIRQSRKRVKDILCDIGFNTCKELLDDLKCFDPGDDCFENTEWDDFTDGYYGKRRKRWPYRTEKLCCALCWFSTQSWVTFRGHIQRCHDEELDLSSLLPCPNCTFISHPKVTNQHVKLFHGGSAKTTSASCTLTSTTSMTTIHSVSTTDIGDKYSCRGCGYHDSLIYVMRKHVLVNHYRSLLNSYFGHRTEAEQAVGVVKKAGVVKLSKFFCRMCHMPAETSEHLLYHILSSDKHKELHLHIKPFIIEHIHTNLKTTFKNSPQQKLPNLAPKAHQRVASLLSKDRDQQQNGRTLTKSPSAGTMLLAAPRNPTALVCGPDSRHIFLSDQNSGGKSLILTQQAMGSLQNRAALPTSTLGKPGPIRMILPPTQQSATKRLPITIGMPQPRQVLLPPGVQINVQNKMAAATQPIMLTQTGPRGPVMSSQSVRLVPTGNKVNGMPTYTLETVQVAVPFQSTGVTQVVNKNVLVAQNVTTLQQQNKPPTVIVMGNGPLSNQSPGLSCNQPSVAMNQTQGDRSTERPKELVVQTQFLKKMENNTVKCTKCKTLLSEKGIFQHLLHGLQCVLCPLVFYSIRQVMDHMCKEHRLSDKANWDILKDKYRLGINPQGNLLFPFFDMCTTVPKDLLADKELNVILVTSTKDRIYLKLRQESVRSACQNLAKDGCPFCPEKPQNDEDYELHLKSKHHIVPTIHAILKAPAFKCVYCLGVYTEKSTPRTISIHVQRCRCAPKAAKDAERLINPDPNAQTINGGVPAASLEEGSPSKCKEAPGVTVKQDTVHKNKPGAFSFDPTVPLVLDPTGMEMRSFEDRKAFLTNYFHLKPYLSRMEVEALAGRLWFPRTDVTSLFGAKRNKCMKALRQKRTKVLLGFNWTELNKLKHDLVVPVAELAVKAESVKVEPV
ncbi:hypothetical protein UPYG_G00157620 [Umbra pygmaea]|uniref:C2H2-type domain-containing protein n=1 Tax=Umbra pygmaea TaxID=75934 RepID=A0ABD0WYK5_UMBPY